MCPPGGKTWHVHPWRNFLGLRIFFFCGFCFNILYSPLCKWLVHPWWTFLGLRRLQVAWATRSLAACEEPQSPSTGRTTNEQRTKKEFCPQMSLNQENFLFNQCFTCNLHYAFGALTYCYGSGFWGTLHLPWRLTKSYKCDYFTSFTQRPAPLVGHQVQQLERFWPGNFNSASKFTSFVSYHRNSSQIFLPWCFHKIFWKQIAWVCYIHIWRLKRHKYLNIYYDILPN